MLFFAMGCERLHLPLMKVLVDHFDNLASQLFSTCSDSTSSPKKYTLSVDEEPLLIVTSSDFAPTCLLVVLVAYSKTS